MKAIHFSWLYLTNQIFSIPFHANRSFRNVTHWAFKDLCQYFSCWIVFLCLCQFFFNWNLIEFSMLLLCVTSWLVRSAPCRLHVLNVASVQRGLGVYRVEQRAASGTILWCCWLAPLHHWWKLCALTRVGATRCETRWQGRRFEHSWQMKSCLSGKVARVER